MLNTFSHLALPTFLEMDPPSIQTETNRGMSNIISRFLKRQRTLSPEMSKQINLSVFIFQETNIFHLSLLVRRGIQ